MSIFIVSDGKPGHQNQTIGLAEALIKVRAETSYTLLEPLSFLSCLLILLGLKNLPYSDQPNSSDIILGAGHRTHWTLLTLKLKSKAFTAVLMKPSLPMSCFDLCIIPEHDNVPPSQRVFLTKGAINRVQPSNHLNPDKGLILIGGESKHYQWDSESIIAQLSEYLTSTSKSWTLTTSRRTPDGFLSALAETNLPIEVIPFEQTNADWLPKQLQSNQEVWVSPDSVSMIYEALSCGATVKIFELEKSKPNRINQSIDQLLSQKLVSLVSNSETETAQKEPLQEADRTAKYIVDQRKNIV